MSPFYSLIIFHKKKKLYLKGKIFEPCKILSHWQVTASTHQLWILSAIFTPLEKMTPFSS